MPKTVEVRLRPAQMEVFVAPQRFRVLVAGRRFGKTHLALLELIRAVAGGPGKTAWYVAPSAVQAKRIAWARLKEMTRPFWAAVPSETSLSVRLRGGGTIAVRGADRPDALRGHGLDFVVLDEYASMRATCWDEVLRPMLSDRQGGALFVGTPQGSDHLWERFRQAQEDPEWAAFRFSTLQGGNVTAAELASAKRGMDERLFRQEFEASFEGTAVGQAYHAFARAEHVRAGEFRRGEPLIWTLDFNVHPMCALLLQRHGDVVQVLDEIVLPDAHTLRMCEAFRERVLPWLPPVRAGWDSGERLVVEVYGDASGHQRRTSGTGTDWTLIRSFFADREDAIELRVRAAAANPAVRDRVNVVNSRLRSADGAVRLFVDPRCRELIRDLEAVHWKCDAARQPGSELDKGDRARTHVSDALGYYLVRAFPLVPKAGFVGARRVV